MNETILEYPTDYIDKIICGDCIDVMRQMPDNTRVLCSLMNSAEYEAGKGE